LSKDPILHSAETYVREPADLWINGLPKRLRDKAFRFSDTRNLDAPSSRPRGQGQQEDEEYYVWVSSDGEPLGEIEGVKRRDSKTTTSAGLLDMLNRAGITGAVLYPSIAMRAFSACHDKELLDAFLDVYNQWILDIAMAAPARLKAIVLLNVDDPVSAVSAMHRLAQRGAAGFVIPIAPGEGCRYDQARYEALWSAASELERPLSLLAGAHRGHRSASISGEENGSDPTPATRLAFKATSVFPARRSITAIIYAGVFERYSKLRIGVVGFGAGWAAYAMVRADEMYQVRPERTGPPTRTLHQVDIDEGIRHLELQADVAIASDNRSGTVGMAPEGVGYHFPPGVRFSDHFRQNVFLTFDRDPVGLALREFLETDQVLWGCRLGEFHAVDNTVIREYLDSVPQGGSAERKQRLVSANTARIYGFS
jgi:predicted TIM-barrel fold metal-dependent hydrolase